MPKGIASVYRTTTSGPIGILTIVPSSSGRTLQSSGKIVKIYSVDGAQRCGGFRTCERHGGWKSEVFLRQT